MRSTSVVSGTTWIRLSAVSAALLRTTTAGRALRASPPTEGSKAIHQTSPRRGSAIAGRGCEGRVHPLRSFRLAVGVRRHSPVPFKQLRFGHQRLGEVV